MDKETREMICKTLEKHCGLSKESLEVIKEVEKVYQGDIDLSKSLQVKEGAKIYHVRHWKRRHTPLKQLHKDTEKEPRDMIVWIESLEVYPKIRNLTDEVTVIYKTF